VIHLHWYKEGETPAIALPLINECGVKPSEEPFARMACLLDDIGECVAIGRLAFVGLCTANACFMEYKSGYISDFIYVKESARGKGYGDFMTRAVLEKALYHKAPFVRVLSRKEDAAFFERYGLRAVSQTDGCAVMEAKADELALTCADRKQYV
jgi:GNAT superfamily N-acetyltransferase